jgi:uncharacterized protein DUF3971/AsmA-like protein
VGAVRLTAHWQRPRRTPVQHVVHHTHRLLVWLGGLTAVLTLVAVVAVWRLLQGPVELDRLVPYVEEALQRSGAGIGVTVAGVSIGIDRDTHQLDLWTQDARLSLPSGEKLANLPQMAVSFSLGALLGGRIEPTRLIVEHPVVALTRDEAGAFSFRVGNPDISGDQLALASALALLVPVRPDAPWGRLGQIVIRDATIILDDRSSGRTWRADRATATLQRSEEGSSGDASFAIALGGNKPELRASYRYAAATQQLDLKLAADGVDPAELAPLSPSLAPLAQVQFPVSGTADIRFDMASGKPNGGHIDLGFGEGQITTDLLVGGSLPVAQGELHADYAPDSAELRLDRLALDLHDGTTLVVDGKLDGLQPQLISTGSAWPAQLAGTLGVTLSHVPATRLNALWPQGVAKGGKRWATANLSDGMFDEVAMRLGVSVDPAGQSVAFSGAHGTMRFHDMTVDYLNGLPPARKVSGTANLADRRLDFAFSGGQLKALKATGGTVTITDLGAPVETMVVDIGIAGPLQEALDIIDTKPLRYAHEVGLDPARIGGKADAQLHFKLPLVNDLKFDMVDYGAKATLTGISYAKVAFDRPLTDGNLTLELGHDGVHGKGSGKFDGDPATIDGNFYFHAKTGPRSRYRIGLALDNAARQRLGWDMGNRLSGPVEVDLTYTVPSGGTHSEVDATVDLGAASLAVDEADWKKPPQLPATATLVVELNDDAVVGIPQIDVKAPGLDGKFDVVLTADERIERVDIHHLAIADSDIAGTVSRRADGGWRADIHGARLNLHHALRHALDEDTPGTQTPLAIEAHLAHLALGPRREAQDVSATLLREHGFWQAIKLDGHYANGRRLALTLGGQKLHFESDDLGASLALFGIADNVVGGKLTIDGTLGDANGHRVLRAHLDGSDYSLVRAPALARLLSLSSFDAIAAMMTGSGIPFTNLRGDVSFSQGRIAIDRLIAYGGALGITAKGWLNPGRDQVDIDGTLAPAYALNSVVGNFPVIGAILAGGEGQGLFAASFRLSGSNDDPTVTVNPLSALTPGMFRHLFDPMLGSAQTGAPPPPPPAQPEAAPAAAR